MADEAQDNSAPDPALPQEAVAVVGGAKATRVVSQSIVPEPEEGEPTANVITTAPGTLGPGGIVPVGTKAEIPVRLYSRAWMKPASARDAKKLEQ